MTKQIKDHDQNWSTAGALCVLLSSSDHYL